MKINSILTKFLACYLVITMGMAPGMAGLVLAQAAPTATPNAASTASDDEIQTVQQLAKAGYLGDRKDYFLKSQTLTEDDITDAILKAKDYVMAADLKDPQLGKTFLVADLQAFLDVAKDKAEDIRARKVSAWKLENRLQKMIALLSAKPESQDASEAVTTAATPVPANTAVSSSPAPTPIPGPTKQEFSDLKDSFKGLNDKLASLQADFDKKTDTIQTLQKSNSDIQSANADIQEQLKLVKKLLDRVQDDLGKSEARMDGVEKKVEEKMVTDTEMQQEMTVMHKDLRDDTEDISILKEEVAKLDKTDKGPKNPLDSFLDSKWLSGGALLIGLAALTVSLTRK